MTNNLHIGTIKAIVKEVVEEKPQIKKVYLFGSFARCEQTSDSDLDFCLETERGFTLTDASGVRLDLMSRFNREVDVVGTHPSRNARVNRSIEKDRVLVYERLEPTGTHRDGTFGFSVLAPAHFSLGYFLFLTIP